MGENVKEIIFYYRDGCHLCEEMAAGLHLHWPEYFEQMSWVPVDSSPELLNQYGDLIPALVVAKELVCWHFFDMEKLTACFGPASNPV